jgi:arsenite methyltransferase
LWAEIGAPCVSRRSILTLEGGHFCGGGIMTSNNFQELDPQRIERLNRFREEISYLQGDLDATQERYGAAADESEAALCCPVEYDRESLSHIPQDILDIDYGCGDPTVFAEEGQIVLDLGSGSGKHAFMIAKKVGPNGRVIGVDKTPAMLDKARAATAEVMANLGYPKPMVEFRRGQIENLKIDIDDYVRLTEGRAIDNYDAVEAVERELEACIMIPDESVDLVVSNCVLNLVDDQRKSQLMKEIYRVVKKTGSVAISDIVADRPIPEHLKKDDHLWTGCLSGAFQWQDFHQAFAKVGFHGMTEAKSYFWQRVEDINFYSVTILAYKGKVGPCYETYRSALYTGPMSQVSDDDGHIFVRGKWERVCEKTANLLSRPPYAGHFQVTPALEDVEKKIPFDCSPKATQDGFSSEMESRFQSALDEGACCEPGECC